MMGAFHGAMPSTTPAGWRTAMETMPGLSDGMISPVIWVVSAAASRSTPAPRCTLKPDHGAVAPVSSSIRRVNSSARLSMRSAALFRSERRSFGPVSDQLSKAFAADFATASTSARLAAGAVVATFPVTGSLRSNVLPDVDTASLPSMMKPIVVMIFSLFTFHIMV